MATYRRGRIWDSRPDVANVYRAGKNRQIDIRILRYHKIFNGPHTLVRAVGPAGDED